MKKLVSMLIAIVILFPALFTTGFLFKKDKWTAFFYPNGVSGEVIVEEPFSSKEAALDWCYNMKKNYISNGYSSDAIDFEVGRNCKLKNKDLQLYICEETTDTY